jgi:transposase InsO family protein
MVYIAPGWPMQNGYIESSAVGCATNFSMRACSWISVRHASSSWTADYNNARPHSSLGYKTRQSYAGILHRARRRRLPPDLGDRQAGSVAPNVPNRKWIADFTYVWTAKGWLYVAAVIDLF